jgi:hypothetical protein
MQNSEFRKQTLTRQDVPPGFSVLAFRLCILHSEF